MNRPAVYSYLTRYAYEEACVLIWIRIFFITSHVSGRGPSVCALQILWTTLDKARRRQLPMIAFSRIWRWALHEPSSENQCFSYHLWNCRLKYLFRSQEGGRPVSTSPPFWFICSFVLPSHWLDLQFLQSKATAPQLYLLRHTLRLLTTSSESMHTQKTVPAWVCDRFTWNNSDIIFLFAF